MESLTIIMYHYVRELKNSAYPNIKGRSVDEFCGQLTYLKKNFTLVNYNYLRSAIKEGEDLPSDACLLTFDDGYIDHYQYVFPLLTELGIQGMFFPPAMVIKEHKVLDVNKIHYILASEPDHAKLVAHIHAWIDDKHESHDLKAFATYWKEWAVADDYDPAEVIFIKRMLQIGLPRVLRSQLINVLFRDLVSTDEVAFSKNLYMTEEHLREIVEAGHYVGNHGWSHRWLNSLPPDEQAFEVDRAIGFLEDIGAPTQDWIMGYPYGGWNESLLKILKSRQCLCGMTTIEEVSNLKRNNPLLLPRLDTNRFPLYLG